jgi:protein-tyrosine phosphatase
MIDIHHHLLFDTDDGPRDIESSIAQAEAAAADGITHIACTPHANDTYEFVPERNEERLAAINERLCGKVTLGLGCDFHLSYENIEDALKNPTKYTINHGKYLLVEFAEYMIPENIGDTFYEFAVRGMRPIITHPERNPLLQRDSSRMADWMRTGCLVQVTASSLGGRFGKRAQHLVWQMLEKKWVHFIATDAHNLAGRGPSMKPAFEAITKRFGEDTAWRLCVGNPKAAFNSEKMPPQPEPEGVYDQDEPPKPTLWERIFGR